MEITIREMQTNDYSGIKEVDLQSQIQYLGNTFRNLSENEQDKCLVSRLSEWSLNLSSGYCLVALLDNNIVGFLFAFETLPFRGTLFIRYIAITPSYQGKGIGLLLYKALISKAKANDIKEINGLINIDNPNSVSLAIKAGFQIIDRKEVVLKLS